MERPFDSKVRSEKELKQLQLNGLKWTVEHAYNGSEHYRRKLEEAGITPDAIKSLSDIHKLPFTTSKDLQEGYPFPLRSAPFEKVVRIHASSGTTGKRKVLCYTANDIEDWANMFARCYSYADCTPEDRVQIAVGYGVWTAGWGFQNGCERFGAMSIPIGPGNTDMQCQFLEDFGTTVMTCTASMGLLMAELIEERGLRGKISLNKMIFGSERASDAMRQRISELSGVAYDQLYDIPGMTELYGPGTGLDCRYHTGIHYWADYYILEILHPETLKPVPDGEVGEMVVTTLRKEGVPLIRYRTRDLTRIMTDECPCGSMMPRHDRILGRSDDMFIFRAVNIYPSHIDQILSHMKDVGSEYQVRLYRKEKGGKDHMTVRVERAQGLSRSHDADKHIRKAIEKEIKKQILVSCDVEVEDYGSLPRSERKTKRVFDERDT
ncbi:MAG: phenylacetate--CoA ligase [Syntrophorhabdaceae bacterium]|nr:phenylacetate--CoA ligase [Syntrophorhabdaceae bacterium]MDD4195569.1 phenylacetate--CoA ligase [Syntrophorhabdaceae bacterium]